MTNHQFCIRKPRWIVYNSFMKTSTLPANRVRLLASLLIVCFAVSVKVHAVTPAPDGGYPGFNTAEGQDPLFSLTTGTNNTAVGFDALYFDTSGSFNTATGFASLFRNTTGHDNAAGGFRALFSNTTGFQNTATGSQALYHNTTGRENTAIGSAALLFNSEGNQNSAIGASAMFNNISGSNNTAIGYAALGVNRFGSGNIALGYFAGSAPNLGNNNIYIGNTGGVELESNTIRIGTQGTQLATFVAGIYGETTGSTTTLPVIVDLNGQLGTAASSERFKKDIKPMDKSSEAILALKPVTFHYKNDNKGTPQFGLVAEEVEKINPALIVRDAKGEIYTVRYEAVNAMLLNEFLKEHRTVEELKREIAGLAATVREQAAQIQKVSAQIELSERAPQTVLNNR